MRTVDARIPQARPFPHWYHFVSGALLLVILLACTVSAQTADEFTRIRTISPSAQVYGLSYLPDGQMLVGCTTQDGIIRYWNANTGISVGTISTGLQLHDLMVSADGQVIASYGLNVALGKYQVKLWRASDNTLMRTITSVDGTDYGFALSPDGQYVAFGSAAKVSYWRASDGSLVHTFTDLSGFADGVRFSPDNQRLATGGTKGQVWLWRLSDYSLIGTYSAQASYANHFSFSPDGELLAIAGDHGNSISLNNALIWRLSDGVLLRTVTQGSGYGMCGVQFSPNGKILATANHSGDVSLWRVSDGECLGTTNVNNVAGKVYGFTFTPDGRTLAFSKILTTIPEIIIWNVASYHPDLQPQAADGSYLGKRVYQTAVGQTLTQAVGPRATARYQVRLENAGTVADTVTLTGTKGANGWAVRYYDAADNTDLTDQITGLTGYPYANLAVEDPRELRVEVTPDGTMPVNSVFPVTLTAASAGNPLRGDSVSLQTTYAPLTAVSLAASPVSPTAVGVPVHLTAVAQGGIAPRYRFRALLGTTATEVQAYGTANTATWTPTAPGTYTLVALCKEADSTKVADVSKAIAYTVKPALSTLTLAASRTSPISWYTGERITLTAASTGGVRVRYWFRVANSGQWSDLRPYDVSNIAYWTPPAPGAYTLEVRAQEVGSANAYDLSTTLPFTVGPPIYVTAIRGTPSLWARVNVPVTITATASGSVRPLQYAFRVIGSSGTTGFVSQAFSPSNTWTFTPTTAALGSYSIICYVHEEGSPREFDAVGAQRFVVY